MDALVSRGADWRWATLASAGLISGDGTPSLRTLVLRSVDMEAMSCDFYTDARSPKVQELLDNPCCSLMFFDRDESIQLRAAGRAKIDRMDDGGQVALALRELWNSLPDYGRGDYLTRSAPSCILEGDGQQLDVASGPNNFARIRVTISDLDWLKLSRSGHIRAAFKLTDGQLMDAHFLVP